MTMGVKIINNQDNSVTPGDPIFHDSTASRRKIQHTYRSIVQLSLKHKPQVTLVTKNMSRANLVELKCCAVWYGNSSTKSKIRVAFVCNTIIIIVEKIAHGRHTNQCAPLKGTYTRGGANCTCVVNKVYLRRYAFCGYFTVK